MPTANNKHRKVALIIMDGWGIGESTKSNAIYNANLKYVNTLNKRFPNSQLITCGTAVGLPDGQMGNSEVGHLNIGAGRIVYQELEKINVEIKSGSFLQNKILLQIVENYKQNNQPIHLLGLLSDGGVHSHINHLFALLDFFNNHQVHSVFIHAFTDGRDTDPKNGINYLKQLTQYIQQINSQAQIATITGRYYAMDRDKRWDRVALAYSAMVNAQGEYTQDIFQTINIKYQSNETDEFIKPIIAADNQQQPIATIKDNHTVLCFNFRTDRCREITEVLTQQDFPEVGLKKLNLSYNTFTTYDKSFKNIGVLFTQQDLSQTLGEVISKNNLTQTRMAETEKYPHVTFFFNGGREIAFAGENRIMADSPKDVATYDLKPEMSAIPLTQKAIAEIQQNQPDFLCINYANADMVGHTGVMEAVIKAVETVDDCVSQLAEIALKHNYTILLTADHGNADYMINEDCSPNTAHTLNPVPFFVISDWYKGNVKDGILADIAPTILHLMNLTIPSEMTGKVLVD
jgi:2,3-bisphosphoglycerate-independent phosphoglycerate mutase